MKGSKPSNGFRKGCSSFRKGVKLTYKIKLKISKSKKGQTSPMKGKNHTTETKQKIRLKKIGMNTGESNHNWKGGYSLIDKSIRSMVENKEWRTNVFIRDKWTCQTCSIRGVYVTAHHIKSFSKIIKEHKIKTREEARRCSELWDINNGVTLCEECHKLTDNYCGKGICNKKTL